MQNVYLFYPNPEKYPSTLYTHTYVRALQNLAPKLHFNFIEFKNSGWRDILEIPGSETPTIIIYPYDCYMNKETMNKVREKFSKLKLIPLGADMRYYHGGVNAIDYKPDLFIDPMMEVVNEGKSLFPSRHIWWSISETTIKEIEDLNLDETKEIDAICLCNDNHPTRNSFFKKLDSCGVSLKRNLHMFNMEEVYRLYSKCWICLGITCPIIKEYRTMKGFRDWIAPFCGTILIYDDYPDIVNEFSSEKIVPIYPYMNECEVKSVLNLLKESGKNSFIYQALLDKQKKWAKLNTMEAQLEKIFLEEKVLVWN